MTSPCISVIIPLYQAEAYIEQCLGSLLAQTFGDFEALCIDDASPDCSFERAKAFVGKDPRFRFFKQPENRGQAAARNVGLDHARGDYIVFLDSDDFLIEVALEHIAQAMRKDQLDVLHYTAQSFYESEESFKQLNEDYEQGIEFEGVISGTQLFTYISTHGFFWDSVWLFALTRSLVKDCHLRFYEGIIHEDALYAYLALFSAKRSAYLSEPLYHRRVHAGSTMTLYDNTVRSIHGRFVCTQEVTAWLSTHAQTLDSSFLKAIGKRLATIRATAGVAWCSVISAEEQTSYLKTLSSSDRLTFETQIASLGRALCAVYNSRTYRLGDALACGPRSFMHHLRARKEAEHNGR